MKTKKKASMPSGFTRGVKVSAKKSTRRHARKPRGESRAEIDVPMKTYEDALN